jgi:NAD(P)-dependent dehydrogenase (short-subunit alcohol dehydrogenase family)
MTAKPRIAVIGAGLMGHGIAQVFALAGHDVTIYDPVMAALDSVKARISANLRDLGDDPSAVDGITKALGCEWGNSGITVNALGPTVFRSPLTEWMFADDERGKTVRAGFLTRVPKGRLGEPSDLAGPLLFLASKASDFYTGHILYADGGYTAG